MISISFDDKSEQDEFVLKISHVSMEICNNLYYTALCQ